MNGIVSKINSTRGLIAIDTSYGFTIIELLSSEDIEIGDVLSWDDETALGGETYTNISKNYRFEVIVQNHDVSISNLNNQLRL